jgi:MFS family permease
MGGILTMPNFLNAFPSINPNESGISGAEQSSRSTNQGELTVFSDLAINLQVSSVGITVASYTLGCFFGAIITIWIGNPLGRKRMIMLGTSIMCIGAILQASATTLPHLIIGRIITGLGNGGNTSTVRTHRCTLNLLYPNIT